MLQRSLASGRVAGSGWEISGDLGAGPGEDLLEKAMSVVHRDEDPAGGGGCNKTS